MVLREDRDGREARVGGGSSSSFELFYRDNYGPVVGLAYVLSGSWPQAEEIAQEAFLRALARWDGRLSRPEGWVRQVSVNLARSRLRRVGAEARAYARLVGRGSSDVPERDPVPVELEGFWAAVRELPARQAEAVALYYLEDLSVVQVAGVMGCAPGTVKALLHRGRHRLAARLDVEEV